MIRINPSDIITLRTNLLEALSTVDYTKSETPIIAEMTKVIPDAVNTTTFTGSTKISAGSVFVHQSPYVKCKGFTANYVEIGDLLLLRKEDNKGKKEGHRALLLQAKRIDKPYPPCKPYTPKDKDQYLLYNAWPEFEYTRPTLLCGKKRHIRNRHIWVGTKYLLISKGSSNYIKTAIPTMPHLSFFHCFIDEIIQFIFGYAGKPYYEPLSHERGWNKVIEDLTTIIRSCKIFCVNRYLCGVLRDFFVLGHALTQKAQKRHFLNTLTL